MQGGSGEAGAEGTAPLTCTAARARPQTRPSRPTPGHRPHTASQAQPAAAGGTQQAGPKHCQNEAAPALASMQPGPPPVRDGTQQGPGLAAGPSGSPPRFIPAGQALGCCCRFAIICKSSPRTAFVCLGIPAGPEPLPPPARHGDGLKARELGAAPRVHRHPIAVCAPGPPLLCVHGAEPAAAQAAQHKQRAARSPVRTDGRTDRLPPHSTDTPGIPPGPRPRARGTKQSWVLFLLPACRVCAAP